MKDEGCGGEYPVELTGFAHTPSVLPRLDFRSQSVRVHRLRSRLRVNPETANESLLTKDSTGKAYGAIDDKIDGQSCI